MIPNGYKLATRDHGIGNVGALPLDKHSYFLNSTISD
jgi:hypothetical protein